MYSLVCNQKYVDITLCGISSVKYFDNLNFNKILNKEIFENNLRKMKKYEEIKNIL